VAVRNLVKRLARLEARSGCGWHIVEVGADWQGDIAAALGLAPRSGAKLLIITQYGDPNAPPRLADPPSSHAATREGGWA
jgi:hypothetical protein